MSQFLSLITEVLATLQAHYRLRYLEASCCKFAFALLIHIVISFDFFVVFSRDERTHPNFVSQAREIENFFVKTVNWLSL